MIPGDAEARRNSFDHLRLLAAFAVLFTHQYDVYQRPWAFGSFALGVWAVGVFFAMSGYLNARSILTSRAPLIFLASRALRIYPALIFCVGMTVLLGAALTTRPLTEYFGQTTFEYFWHNAGLFFGQRLLLPGVFEGNPVQGTNASLWTLPIEGRFYLILTIAIFLTRYRPRLAIIGAAGLLTYLVWLGDQTLAERAGRWFALMFVSGVSLAALEICFRARASVVVIAVLAVAAWFAGQGYAAISICIATLFVLVGKCRMPQAFRLPLDISYGVYLFAYPIQQLMVTLGFQFWTGLAAATATTIVVATISAILVELPALRLARWLKARRSPGANDGRLFSATA